jgi:hypothetical protein
MADKLILPGSTGYTASVIHTETDGTVHVEEKQNVEPILDYCEAGRNTRFNAPDTVDGMFRHEGEIPFVVFQEECRLRGVVPFSPESDLVMEYILAAPKYAKFRAAPTVRDPGIIIKGRR